MPMRTPSLRATLLALAVTPVLFAAQAAIAASEPDTETRNRQIVTEAFERWEAGGTTFFADVLSPDVVWTIEGSGPSAGRYEGRDVLVDRAVRPLVGRLSTPIRPVAKTVWADGDHVIVTWEGVATAADGQPYVNRYAWILRMQDGRATEVNAFLDLAVYDDVLRRIPAPPAE